MKYEYAPDLQAITIEVCQLLFPHVKLDRVKCFRSYGSSSKYTIARCHTIGKLMQQAMGVKAFYALEFISKQFDKLDEEEQIKTIIHEIMHIPKTFGGGFRQHDYVCDENVDVFYKEYMQKKKTQHMTPVVEVEEHSAQQLVDDLVGDLVIAKDDETPKREPTNWRDVFRYS